MLLLFEFLPAMPAPSLAALWRELEARSDAAFFLTWDWIGSWLEGIGAEPVVLIGRSDGRIVLLGLLLPSERHEFRLWSTHGLRLHTTGDDTRDVITIEYNGFLVDRDWSGRAEREAIAFLTIGMMLGGRIRNELHLRGVEDVYETFLPPGRLCQVAARKPSWRIDLEAVRQSGRPYLDHLSANTRQQIRRSLRLYERRGPLTTRRAASVPEAMDFLEELKTLHQRTWTARGEPGGFAYPLYLDFLHRLTEQGLPRGTIELVRVDCGGAAIGYVCNFRRARHVFAYLTGLRYEPDPKLKPGLVSHTLCIERHVNEGALVYDFMAGENRYKANLGVPGPEMLYLIVQRPTATIRLEHLARRLRDRLRRRAG